MLGDSLNQVAQIKYPCLASGCGRTVPHRLVMCRAHWNMTGPKERTEVRRAYRDGAGAETPEFAEALRLARISVAAEEARRKAFHGRTGIE